MAALELGNVGVVAGDLHDLDAAALGGRFDLAYTRLFLMHRLAPSRTCHGRHARWVWRSPR